MSGSHRSSEAWRWSPGRLLAVVILVVSILCLVAAYRLSSGTAAEFFANVLVNAGTGFFTIALTLGVIDYWIEWDKKRKHADSIQPAATTLLHTFREFTKAHANCLSGSISPSDDALMDYGDLIRQVGASAQTFSGLVNDQQPALAALLTSFTGRADSHLKEVQDASNAVQYHAPDAGKRVERVRKAGAVLLEEAGVISEKVSRTYNVDCEQG